MIRETFTSQRDVKEEILAADLVVVGGGMSGVCCAITAARAGISVILVQDRPVLGGNASSEVRLWILGATSSQGNNNRWAREGGVIDEILLENLYRNREGNPVMLDALLLEKVYEEPGITLLLNTSVYQVNKSSGTRIGSVTGFCSQNSTRYVLGAPLFCDASGDGIVAFQAGASFRMGAEKPETYGEGFAPNVDDYGELLGHSIYFRTRDTGHPVLFTAPSFALKDAGKLPRLRNYRLSEDGCRLWWVEYGGRLDTVHQSEQIKWELWKVVYGIWDYVKNSGDFPEAETYTLEWVGTIPGKRESRRFEGDYTLIQQDIVEQREHDDFVCFGGWAMDLHPADGVYSDKNSCTQWHAKGVYGIPYRCFYSRDLDNLFLAGRIISASHVAFGSTRVMATCAHGAQAVGMAAALAIREALPPRDISKPPFITRLQRELNKTGQSIPGIPIDDQENLANRAIISASSTLQLSRLDFDGPWLELDLSAAQMLPLKAGVEYTFQIQARAAASTTLRVELCTSSQCKHFTPDIRLEQFDLPLEAGEQRLVIPFRAKLPEDHYVYLIFRKNPEVRIRLSRRRVTGLLSVFNQFNPAVSNYGRQTPPDGIGIDSFEFWTPRRRPGGHNIAFEISPVLDVFTAANLNNGYTRPLPGGCPNAWVADFAAETATLELQWEQPQSIGQLVLIFDTDTDHPLESTLRGHVERRVPFCIQRYRVYDDRGNLIGEERNNYKTVNRLRFPEPLVSRLLKIEVERPDDCIPPSIFEVMVH